MTRYQVFLYVYIAAAAIWVGGATMLQFSPLSFSDDWITIVLILVATAYALAIGVMEPLSTQIRDALAAGGVETALARGRLQTIVSRNARTQGRGRRPVPALDAA